MTFSMDSLWFEVALICGITAFGSIFFGHFEEHTPKLRRVLKLILLNGVAVTVTLLFGRMYTLFLLGIVFVAFVYIHGFWLPSKGINGFTGEPREKYYKLRGWKMKK